MARTKQTARKSASGHAKPVQLAGRKRPRTSSTASLTLTSSSPLSSCPSSPELRPISKESNRFCYLCHDGGRAIACSNSGCPRVVCDVCIEMPESIANNLNSSEISFKCPACHEKEERAARSKPMPYIAFTQTVQGKSVPACDEPTFVSGVCERASKSQVRGGPILIIHFVFTGLNVRGSVPRVLNTALEEYHSEETLRYLEVVFDFGTCRKLRHWQTEAESLAATIGEDIFQQKIFFISVHSEVTRGDLFAGKDEQGSDVAVRPKEFMNYLFSGGVRPLVHGATLFMLSCGPLLAFPDSVSSLRKGYSSMPYFCVVVMTRLRLANRLRPAYTIAFGAKRFISAVIKSFIVAFGVRVVIQGHDLGEVFKDLLDVSVELPMHTDAYIFEVKERAASGTPTIHVSGTRYLWFHSHRRPWGTPLPMSCPKCSSIRSWSPSKSGEDQSGAPGRISMCQSPTCGFKHFSYQPQAPYEIIKTKVKDNEGKGWIKQTGI
ncbi:hypothetical protein EDD15DRAFT_2379410 [Pisolithus albus]|nr:hypothetical protein EDD15DRAFT_2379410 [Pisolithus albus]